MGLDFLSVIDEKQALLRQAADFLWEHPETAFTEYESAGYLCRTLREEGFAVKENLAGIPTAFSGRFGSGRPVIGILGEFDALSGLGQVACVTEKQPDGKPCGHGCGHHLLGAGALGAAIAVKRYLEETGASGSVIYYGCPGEEGGSGKTFMARDGVFDELDAAISWHPDDETGVRTKNSLANCEVLYRFDGIAAHAGIRPDLGRSALDAVELMNVGANFLREHMIPEARVHYAITDAGGSAPNVVQPHAEVLYLIRAPHSDQVRHIYERVNNIAHGAALMTGTKTEHTWIKACSEIVLNNTLEQLMYEKMLQIGSPEIIQQDISFARELTQKALLSTPAADPAHPIHAEIKPFHWGEVTPNFGSTDVGDVSWICPTVQCAAATWARGTPGHSWQTVSQGKTPLAYKMMIFAAKAMAATAAGLMDHPEILRKAKEEHKARIGANGYLCPIPKDVRPRAIVSL